MPSPITKPSYEVGTICLARFTGKFAKLLIVVYEQSLSASGPLMVSSAMWCDWSNNTALSRQARCSSRQLENSLGTTGYTYAPICELRSILTVLPAALSTLSRFC